MPRACLPYAPRHGGVWAMAHSHCQNIQALTKAFAIYFHRIYKRSHLKDRFAYVAAYRDP